MNMINYLAVVILRDCIYPKVDKELFTMSKTLHRILS